VKKSRRLLLRRSRCQELEEAESLQDNAEGVWLHLITTELAMPNTCFLARFSQQWDVVLSDISD
jgi:hypothetical protein